ncbi:MAG TPA: cob(I)yrinic acid a,c-diamide adenosyltransferase [Candidatus Nitrosocosmicus sp.]|nr:cob(I)yrinic acid a,c-diamide adenosyltransferase [Candidatus Nitrosocosmicus sp.]
MTIYTKTGDTGETSLFGGKRISKADPQVAAYGDIDELSSYLGLIVSKLHLDEAQKEKEFIINIQKELYQLMGVLAGANTDLSTIEYSVPSFEKRIDEIQEVLPKLTRFILPGGNEISSFLHISRTVCRRAERSVVYLLNVNDTIKPELKHSLSFMVKYLNRLSDLLFMLARWHGKDHEIIT